VFAALAVALAVAGFVLGLEEAKANPWRYGEPHGCPAGAAPSKCYYPPDLHAQRFAYSVNGLLLGLLAACAATAVFALVRRYRGLPRRG
jgi:hypothetical protein